MTRVKEHLDAALKVLCVAFFAALVLTVTWQVFSRQVLNSPVGWSEELAKYLFIWLGLLGAALVFGERGHIAVEFVVARFPAAIQRWIGAFGQLVIMVFAATVLVYGGIMVSVMTWTQNLTGLPVNVGNLYIILPITGVFTMFYSLYHLVALIQRRETALSEGDPDVI